MKAIAKILMGCLAGMSVVACKTTDPAVLDGEWAATEIRGEKIEPSAQTPFIGFRVAAGEVYGFTGCNRLTGTADFKQMIEGTADFSKLGMTRMMCVDDVYEQPFMEALNTAKHVKVEADGFVLQNEQGETVARFKKK